MKLPIQIVPNTDPPKFKCKQTVESLIGLTEIDHVGVVPVWLEKALIDLIALTTKQDKEIEALKKKLEDMQPPLSAIDKPIIPIKPSPISSSLKKGKG